MRAKLIKTDKEEYRLYIDDVLPYATTDNGPYKRLSLQNCQAIERGYDLEELAERNSKYSEEDWIDGFKKALEILGDRRFTENDVRKAVNEARFCSVTDEFGSVRFHYEADKIIQSLQQNEWEVELLWETDNPTPFQRRTIIRRLDNGEEIEWECFYDNGWWGTDGVRCPNVIHWDPMPVLDRNNCLILNFV